MLDLSQLLKDLGDLANLGNILRAVVLLLFIFAAILAFIFILIGGIQWITAGGDKAAAQSARDRIRQP